MAARTSTLVCCIGNELVADDAVGCAVYEALRTQSLPPSTTLTYLALGGLNLLDRLEGDERALIVVDAVHFGAPPGTVHCLEWDQLPLPVGAAVSAHALGLREAIEVGQLICPGKLPPTIVLVGIEGRCFDQLGAPMTPETAAAVEPAAQRVRALLSDFE